MIEIQDLRKKFKRKTVLDNISLELEHGVYGLLGDNGAGKTTLMRCIAGLYKDYTGNIVFKDGNRRIGYLPQLFGGLEELCVNDFMRFFADMKGMDKKEMEGEITQALTSVGLEEKGREQVRKLSGGMKRRLGIAQTLLGEPNLILYDEPTTGLDPKERLRFQSIVAENRKKKRTILISTHIVSDVESLCEKIIVLKEGRIIGIYTPHELAKQANGRVFEVSEQTYEKNKDNLLLVKKVYHLAGSSMRVITEKEIAGKSAEATVEDGFLWVSR